MLLSITFYGRQVHVWLAKRAHAELHRVLDVLCSVHCKIHYLAPKAEQGKGSSGHGKLWLHNCETLTSMMPTPEPSLEAAAAAAARLREALAASDPDCLRATSKMLRFLHVDAGIARCPSFHQLTMSP